MNPYLQPEEFCLRKICEAQFRTTNCLLVIWRRDDGIWFMDDWDCYHHNYPFTDVGMTSMKRFSDTLDLVGAMRSGALALGWLDPDHVKQMDFMENAIYTEVLKA